MMLGGEIDALFGGARLAGGGGSASGFDMDTALWRSGWRSSIG